MPRSIERVLAHLILPSLSKSKGLLSSRQATVQPNDNSIGFLNVKHKSGFSAGIVENQESVISRRPADFRSQREDTGLPRAEGAGLTSSGQHTGRLFMKVIHKHADEAMVRALCIGLTPIELLIDCKSSAW